MEMSSDDDESDSETEDSDGELLTEKIESKILDTFQKIRDKNPDIYATEKVFFCDEDFTQNSKSKSTPKTTYRDHISQPF